MTYNSRLQPLQLFYTNGTVPPISNLQQTTCPSTVGNILHRVYNLGAGTNDNGNVLSFLNCRDTNRSENFVYDSLNRVQQAYTTGSNWGETYTVDAWGNLTNIGPVSGKANYENLNAAPASTKNQLNGYCNDSAGNLVLNTTCPTGTFTPTYSYDADNRIASTGGWTYTYDGDGKRVMKCNGSSCTLYWTGTGSAPIAESNGATFAEEYVFFNGARVARRDLPAGTVHYYFSDHLGSTGVVTNSTGSIQMESDYYPFGGEIVVSGSDANHYKFTGKERDAESGLDEFGARYYTSTVGRFMSPDWSAHPSSVPYAVMGTPQSLNLYSYVSGNPVTRIDPDGHKNCRGMGKFRLNVCDAKREEEPTGDEETKESTQAAQNNDTYKQGAVSDDQIFLQQEQAGEKQAAQQAIDRGEPPNGEYSFLFGKSCPDCKYYPKEVVEAVDAHENQHAKDEHTLSGFFKLFTKSGRRELETRAFKAELGVEQRNIKNLESVGQRTPMQEKTLIILRNMRDQAQGAIEFPQVYTF